MNDYTLYNADCLDVFGQLAPQSVDAVICDPPYGTTACKWDSVIPFDAMWDGIRRVLRPRGACVLFGDEPFASFLRVSNVAWFRHDWVWDKVNVTGFLNVNRQPLKRHGMIMLFTRGVYNYSPIMSNSVGGRYGANATAREFSPAYGEFGAERQRGVGYPQSIIRYQIPTNTTDPDYGLHPTQKPLALLEYLVKTYTNAGDVVLDFAMGSGTTGHACGNLGRRFIGIERDAAYFAIAEERIATAYAPLRLMEAAALKADS